MKDDNLKGDKLDIAKIKKDITEGNMIPYFGLGIFEGIKASDESMMPHTNESFILSINNGRAMTPRLMIDYSRAAMSLEQKKGRNHIVGMVNLIYTKEFATPKIVEEILKCNPKYIVDTNYDSKIQEGLKSFTMISGIARILAEKNRYLIHGVEGESYTEVDEMDFINPILLKPMGSTKPEPNFIVSDADFVDWLTEAMGGFAMPPELKEYRKEKSYIFFGIPFDRDTERMVANEITLGLTGGYVVYEGELSKKAAQFLEKHNLEQLKLNQLEFADLLAKN